MPVSYCYFERENYKYFKFRVNNFSEFEINVSFF